jgi:hypothetical protein
LTAFFTSRLWSRAAIIDEEWGAADQNSTECVIVIIFLFLANKYAEKLKHYG